MYVVQLRPMSECKAKNRLIRQGYRALVPMEERQERRQGKWHSRLRILFGSYLFIDQEELSPHDYHRILNNEYVLRFLGEKGQPAKLSESEAELIRFLDRSDRDILVLNTVETGREYRLSGVKLIPVDIQKRQRRGTFKIHLAGEERLLTLSCIFQNDEQKSELIRPPVGDYLTEDQSTGS